MLCACLSIALLAGLLLNALLGWWWADRTAALIIAAVALKEGRESCAARAAATSADLARSGFDAQSYN